MLSIGYPRFSTTLTDVTADPNEANQAIMVVGLALAMLVAIVAYGTVVVEIARFLVAAVGFASLFLGVKIYGLRAFRPSSWMMRIRTILVSCVLLRFSLNYVEDYITATIVYAQRQGYPITNLPDLVRLLGLDGLGHLANLALALVSAVGASAVALVAQFHMLLTAHAATTSDPHDWRVSALAWMGNRSGALSFIPMLLLSLLSLGVASDWLPQVLKSISG